MTNYSYVASYDIRKALWEAIKDNSILDPNDYYADGFLDALVPIIPAQQIPEFTNNLPGKTHIVYDVAQKHTGVQWWMSEETITFDVVSRDPSQIQTIINFITDLFRRYDLSAKEVNFSLDSKSPYTYHFFKLEAADPVQAFQNEGGYMNGIISISYAYTREVDSVTGKYL
jgi:hypothetical protein